jgi:acetyltransferase
VTRIVAAHVAQGPAGVESEHVVELAPGLRFVVRPVRPSDEPALTHLLEHMAPEDVRLRFFCCMRHFGHALMGPLTRLDDGQHVGLVARRDGSSPDHLAAHAMLISLPDRTAEFAVIVQRQFAHQGLGRHLIECLIAEGRARGLRQIYGVVLADNPNMLQLAAEMGFRQRPNDDPGTVRIELDLEPPQSVAA